MEQSSLEILILVMILLLLLSVVIVFLFLVFQKKKNFLIRKQLEEKEQFDKEIVDLQSEIQEQTMRNISWELHDNIGQMLTLAKIQVQNMPVNSGTEELRSTLKNSLEEVRALSKSLNPDFIRSIDLIQALQLEIERFNRMKYIYAELRISGTQFRLEETIETVLFRILQEFFANTLKHSRATELTVDMIYGDGQIQITAKDNGKGFNIKKEEGKGIGLMNIERRGKMINAEIMFSSELGKGSEIQITYPKTIT